VELDRDYRQKGLRILAFPCNQFGQQEPGSVAEIKRFVKGYGVDFTMMRKIDVNGQSADAFWKLLKGPGGKDTNWNFMTKFLLQCAGETCTVERHDVQSPKEILGSIVQKLQKTDL